MEKTLRQILTWLGLKHDVHDLVKTCHICQILKRFRRNYVYLLPKEAHAIPLHEVHVD